MSHRSVVGSWKPHIFYYHQLRYPWVNHLAKPQVATALLDSIRWRHKQGDWEPLLVLFMPDHVHGLFSFPEDREMKKVVASWKRYAARNLGVEWQRDFFDHRIRHDVGFHEKWNYIMQNPVRAGLVDAPGNWPYVWADFGPECR